MCVCGVCVSVCVCVCVCAGSPSGAVVYIACSMCVYACVCAGASGSEFRVFHWEPLPPNQAAAAGESVWNNPMVDMLVCACMCGKR